MDWLITFKKSISADELERILAQSGCTAEESPPIPLGEDEQVISVTGPPDLPRRLQPEEGILKVSPNSPLTLY